MQGGGGCCRWGQELLILKLGHARRLDSHRGGGGGGDEDAADDSWGNSGDAAPVGAAGSSAAFQPGAVWGTLQFLGLEQKHSFSVVADVYCEVMSLSSASIVVGSTAHQRMSMYTAMYTEMEARTSGEVDSKALAAQFRYGWR